MSALEGQGAPIVPSIEFRSALNALGIDLFSYEQLFVRKIHQRTRSRSEEENNKFKEMLPAHLDKSNILALLPETLSAHVDAVLSHNISVSTLSFLADPSNRSMESYRESDNILFGSDRLYGCIHGCSVGEVCQ